MAESLPYVTVHLNPDSPMDVRLLTAAHEFVSIELGRHVSVLVVDPAALDQLAELVAKAQQLLTQPALPELDAA